LGLIEKIGISRDQIAIKLKFWGQLGPKLKKFTAKDQSAKGVKV
jgi:hypothetical protein